MEEVQVRPTFRDPRGWETRGWVEARCITLYVYHLEGMIGGTVQHWDRQRACPDPDRPSGQHNAGVSLEVVVNRRTGPTRRA